MVIIHDQIWLSSLSFVHIIKKGLIDIIVIFSIYELSLFSLFLMFSLLSLFMLSLSFMWSILSIIIIHHTSTTTTMIVLWMTITFVNDTIWLFNIAMENGRFTYYKWWFSIAMLNYQRVKCPFSLNPWTRPPTSVWTLADLAWRAARDPWGWPTSSPVASNDPLDAWCMMCIMYMIDIDRYQLVVICKWLENPFRIHLFFNHRCRFLSNSQLSSSDHQSWI